MEDKLKSPGPQAVPAGAAVSQEPKPDDRPAMGMIVAFNHKPTSLGAHVQSPAIVHSASDKGLVLHVFRRHGVTVEQDVKQGNDEGQWNTLEAAAQSIKEQQDAKAKVDAEAVAAAKKAAEAVPKKPEPVEV